MMNLKLGDVIFDAATFPYGSQKKVEIIENSFGRGATGQFILKSGKFLQCFIDTTCEKIMFMSRKMT